MKPDTPSPNASGEYAAAYAAQYREQDWPLAVQLYRKLLAAHPDEREADYAWMQIQNIVRSVVPRRELLDAQLELLRLRSPHAANRT
jgi:outer membrane protein assembly factor BamD (BamD/ComL family)